MRFKLLEENISNTFYFFTDHKFIPPFEPSEEGIHVTDNLDTLNRCQEGLRGDKKYIYSISTLTKITPLNINCDICLWSGKNLADLFLCKLDNKFYDECFDGQGDIPPTVIKSNKITESDRPFLTDISNDYKYNDIQSFRKIMDFINSKGYNCITYSVWEGNHTTDKAYIFDDRFSFDYSTIKLIKDIE